MIRYVNTLLVLCALAGCTSTEPPATIGTFGRVDWIAPCDGRGGIERYHFYPVEGTTDSGELVIECEDGTIERAD